MPTKKGSGCNRSSWKASRATCVESDVDQFVAGWRKVVRGGT